MMKGNNSNKENTDKVKAVKLKDTEDKSTSALASMGVNNPAQVIRYTLREDGNKDVLKIYYKRAKGSLLPSSRKYKFGRSVNTIITDSGKPEYGKSSDISPILQEAIAELDKVVIQSENTADRKKAVLDEIERMEKSFNSRINELREQVKLF